MAIVFIMTIIRIHINIDNPYSKLLNPVNSTYDMERQLLQPETKMELVLAAYDDLERLANEVKQIKALEHVVNGSDFEAVEKLGPQLTPLELAHGEQAYQLANVTARISQAMDSYNGIVSFYYYYYICELASS
ncbi:unnamed protein product [Absidia cylindrospora]